MAVGPPEQDFRPCAAADWRGDAHRMTRTEEGALEHRVALVESAPEVVLRVPREIRPNSNLLGEDIAEGMREVTRIVQSAGLTASGAPTITFRQDLPIAEAIVVEFGVPVEPAPNLGPSS